MYTLVTSMLRQSLTMKSSAIFLHTNVYTHQDNTMENQPMVITAVIAIVAAVATMTTNMTINAFAQTESDTEQQQRACNNGNEMACNALSGNGENSVQGKDKICTTLHPPNEPPLPMCTKIAGGNP